MFVYADNAATTKPSQVALDAMLPCLTDVYGNPSSLHSVGQKAAETLQAARETVAACLGCQAREIYFTSGGSEADNQAIVSAARLGAKKGKKHIISTAFEHHAVLHTLKKLEKEGFEVELLPVGEIGTVTAEQVKAAIRPDTCLVTIMYANNEIGTIQPIAEIGASLPRGGRPLPHRRGAGCRAMCTSTCRSMNIDMLSLSGHKFHGPKGVGALYCAARASFSRTSSRAARRSAASAPAPRTCPGIVGMAAALERTRATTWTKMPQRSPPLRDQLIAGLAEDPAQPPQRRSWNSALPGNVNVCFEGIEGESAAAAAGRRRASAPPPARPAPPARSTRAMCCWPSGCPTRSRTARCG